MKTEGPPPSRNTWKTLLLIYEKIAVTYRDRGGKDRRFEHAMTDQEIRDGIDSFQHFPALAGCLTSGAAKIETEIVQAARPLATLTRLRAHQFWPSPDDTREEVSQLASPGRYQSILVYWPQNHFQAGTSIPSGGWGLGMGASAWSHHATYATVANAPLHAWQIPLIGEVWLHEWLHGACAHFAARGYRMPERDADGGGLHGYVQSPTTGWTTFYRDLMTGNVLEEGQRLGIPLEAWGESIL